MLGLPDHQGILGMMGLPDHQGILGMMGFRRWGYLIKAVKLLTKI